MSDQGSVEVLRSLSQVEEIRDTWSSWQWHPNSDIDFYLTIVSARSQIRRPHVLVLYRDGKPDAMLVGRMEQSRIDYQLGYWTFHSAHVQKLTFIYGGLLGNSCADNCKALVDQIVKSLREGEGDLAELHYIRTDSPLFQSARQWPGLLSRDPFPATQIHRSTKLHNSGDGFYRSLSPKVRKNLKWQARKLLQNFAGDVKINCFRQTAELQHMIQDVEEIAGKTYQRGLGVGFVDDAEMRQRLHFEAEKGWLRTYLLYVADKPCAFWIGSLYGQTFHSNFMGYDPAYGKYSPGMYLITRTIEDFANHSGTDHPTQIDWGLGDAQYKEVLGDYDWEEASSYIFAPTLRGIRLNALRMSAALTDEMVKKALERTKLLQRVKKIWRDHARNKIETSIW